MPQNAVIGGTGLGKTTLVYALQFAIFGKMVVNASERIEREFFKDRLTRRSGKKLEKNPPMVRVEFTAGPAKFTVRRNLITGILAEVTCDGSEVRANKYEALLAEKIGVKDDFESLARLQSHLFFFGESRYLLAWENMLQHELINLMMAVPLRELLLFALLSSMEDVANARKDGKCWRYRSNWKPLNFSGKSLDEAFAAQVIRFIEDINIFSAKSSSGGALGATGPRDTDHGTTDY